MLHTAQRYSTAIMKIDHPIHNGRPNPAHGKFTMRGSIPEACWDLHRCYGAGGSKLYDTEDAAILAAADGGAETIQGADCRVISAAELTGIRVHTKLLG